MSRAAARILAAAVAVAGGLVHASSDVPVYGGDEHERFGRPSRIVEPVYPPAALEANQGGTVTVTGSVDPLGVIRSPHLVPDSPASEIFLEPLRKALADWEFYVPQDDECMPSGKPISFQVEFAAREHKPHVYVTYAADDPVPAAWKGWMRATDQRPALRYPRGPRRDQVEAVVFERSEIGPDGRVVGIATQAYQAGGDPGASLSAFEREVKEALRRWIYPEEASRPLRKVCNTIRFRLRD